MSGAVSIAGRKAPPVRGALAVRVLTLVRSGMATGAADGAPGQQRGRQRSSSLHAGVYPAATQPWLLLLRRHTSRGLSAAASSTAGTSATMSAGAPTPDGGDSRGGRPTEHSSAEEPLAGQVKGGAPLREPGTVGPVDGRTANGSKASAVAVGGPEAAAALPPKIEADELWIVGRVLQGLDDRLGAKQEKIRQVELGVIDRFARLMLTLDSGLDARVGDDFLVWLNSRYVSVEPSGSEDCGAGARAKVELFLSAAEARLNVLVADKESMLFRDREAVLQRGRGGEGANAATATRAKEAAGQASNLAVSPELSQDELYQIKMTAHRAMLCKCLSLVSVSLGKQHLKPGLTVQEVAGAVRSAYLASPEERLGAMFPLFDSHGDGYLDDESVERVVDAVVVPVTAAAERCYVSAARTSLDKKAASAMPKTMKYTLLDVLEVPVKRRCAVAWAEDRKQVGPDEWRVSWEQFRPSRREHFPQLESVASDYLTEYRKRRSEWHNRRKSRKKAAVYGSALFTAVVLLDNFLSIV